jgi:pimeloyl-ACP methyl ester carboxylesterase
MKPHLVVAALWLVACGQAMASAAITVHCQGQGPLVYLIGGGPAFTTWNLQPIQERLSPHYRVCRWDMRGVGDNGKLVVSPSVPALSQWLDDMAAVLPQELVVLWGHSWGALQVMLFTRRHPERVDRLILSNPVDPALRSLQNIEHKRFNHPELNSRLKIEDIDTPVEDLHNLRSKLASYFRDAAKGWEYAAGFTREDANNELNLRIWEEYREAPLGDADIRQLAGKISGLIYCRDDVLQPEALAEYGRLLDPDKHHVLTGCAHFPWEENPEDYFSVLSRLLERQQETGR